MSEIDGPMSKAGGRARQFQIARASRKSTTRLGHVCRRLKAAFTGHDRPMTTRELLEEAYFDKPRAHWQYAWTRETLQRMGAKIVKRAPGRSHLWEWSATSKST
jgi:hypothetical protein